MQACSPHLSPLKSPGRVAERLSPCATAVDAADEYDSDDRDPTCWGSWHSRDEGLLSLRTGNIHANCMQVLPHEASVTCAAAWG